MRGAERDDKHMISKISSTSDTTPLTGTISLRRKSAPTPAPERKTKIPPESLKAARKWTRAHVPPQPFVVGIRRELEAMAPSDIERAGIGIALRELTKLKSYQRAVISGKCRFGLNGQTSPIEKKHRDHARRVLGGGPQSTDKAKLA
jgi:hypothetical protein